jgi:HK97 family phage prohead protease
VADLSFKTLGGQVGVDDALGIVECFVAAIGNKDSVGDIIVSGAFDKSLRRRKPRVVWGHDWNQPIGKVIDIFEVGASDPRLPGKMKQAGVGAVYARVQFNLKSERGREAFSFVQFFGEEQEWSIGYKTIDAVYDPKAQANVLKELELYEVSPVLHGANQLTSTLSVKGAKKGGDDGDVTSFRSSKWETFDPAWAMKLREEHPEIWSLGGNIKGNAQFSILSKIHEQGGKATTPDQVAALNLREAWVARHKQDFRIAGVVAQIKWLAVGTRGEGYMKKLVAEEIKRRSEKCAPMGAMPGGMMTPRPGRLDAEEAELRDSLLRIVSVHGRFNEDEDGVWAGYTPADENEVADIGVKCANCVFYNGGGSCDIIAMDVEPGGKCRFAVIPKGVVNVDGAMEEDEYDDFGPWLPSGDPEERMKFLEEEDDDEEYGRPMGKAAPGADQLNQISSIVGIDAPQERVTGDVMRGYGPRRGNLERLLRYWRPIMKKPGGFRRCRVILADHPELYPLENICAWLHHETTGLWPNEGCHHPGMKNCRKKLKKGKRIVQGSLFSDAEFGRRLESRFGKSYEEAFSEGDDWNDTDMKDFMVALKDFMGLEPKFVDYLRDDDNWETEGEDDDGATFAVPYMKKPGCGCGGMKSDGDVLVKAGRVLSATNIAKLRQASDLIAQVISSGEVQVKDASYVFSAEDADDLVDHISPVVSNYGLSVSVKSHTVTIGSENMTDEASEAIGNAIGSYLRHSGKDVVRAKSDVAATLDQHREWIAPVASYHGIGYTVKGDMVFYDTATASDEAVKAIETAMKVLR